MFILDGLWVLLPNRKMLMVFTVCAMFNRMLKDHPSPRYISTDHDPIFRHQRWKANLRILDIEEVKTVPYCPMSHPFVERVIGTVKRECLDLTLFWNRQYLDRKLASYQQYYNSVRGHLSLNGLSSLQKADKTGLLEKSLTNYSWISHCNGLFKAPVAG